MRLPPRGKSRGGFLAVEGLLFGLFAKLGAPEKKAATSTPRLKH